MQTNDSAMRLAGWNKPQIKRELDKVLADIPDALGVAQERIDDFTEICVCMTREMQRASLLTVCGTGEWIGGIADLYYIDIDFIYDTLSDDALYDDFKTEAILHIAADKLTKKRNRNHWGEKSIQPEYVSPQEAYGMLRRGIPEKVIHRTISRAEIQAKYPNAFRPVEDVWAERFGF